MTRRWVWGLVAGWIALMAATLSAEPTPSIEPSELRPGQTGYGLTVFSGTEPERFEVEIIGVLPDFRTDLDYVIARLSGHGLEESGVAAGMSGSPVYIDGRLVGAVAFSWNFTRGAIAGITPISGMRRLLELPEVGPLPSGAMPRGEAPDLATLVKRDFPRTALRDEWLRWLGANRDDAQGAVQWHVAGFQPEARRLLDEVLGTVGSIGPGGMTSRSTDATSSDGATGELVAGGAVAMPLVWGDLSMAATGTVTEVDGDSILAIGHPVFSLGEMRLPMATASVVMIVPNLASSFKLSTVGEVIGAFDVDRVTGTRGRVGLEAPTLPMSVEVHGTSVQRYAMQVAHAGPLVPLLVASGAFGTFQTASHDMGGDQGLDFEARIGIDGHDDLVLRQSYGGDAAVIDAMTDLLTFLNYLIFNELESVRLTGVDIVATQYARPRVHDLVAARPSRLVVRPGDEVDVVLDLRAWRGEIEQRTVTVTIPPTASEGLLPVLIGDGTSMDAVALELDRPAPRTFEQSLDYLRSLAARDSLVAFAAMRASGWSLDGTVLPALPGSVRGVFDNGRATALSLARLGEQRWPSSFPIEGVVRVDFDVRRGLQ
ncbi:MAG: hypothetical protein AAGD38_10575 [Acidobacteriota bacterium]